MMFLPPSQTWSTIKRKVRWSATRRGSGLLLLPRQDPHGGPSYGSTAHVTARQYDSLIPDGFQTKMTHH